MGTMLGIPNPHAPSPDGGTSTVAESDRATQNAATVNSTPPRTPTKLVQKTTTGDRFVILLTAAVVALFAGWLVLQGDL